MLPLEAPCQRVRQVIQQSRGLPKCRALYLKHKADTTPSALRGAVMQAAVRQLLKAYRTNKCPCLPPKQDSSTLVRTYTNAWKAWNCECQRQLDALKLCRAIIRYKHKVLNLQRAQERLQLLFDTDQARANKIINQQGNERTNLSVLQDSQGKFITSLKGRLELAHTFFQRLATVPKDRPEMGIPWILRLDHYEIATQATHAPPIITVLTMKQNVNTFARMVRGLSDKKAPGPDGIPNEVLKWLSDYVLSNIHASFVRGYASAYTPDFMKVSTTVVLYKKDDIRELGSYRPITLANTLAKLYTGLLASCMQDWCDAHDLLTDSQEGFRSGKGTMRQLQTVVNMLSDAKLLKRDIYALFVAFPSAFNTIYHDKLWLTMEM